MRFQSMLALSLLFSGASLATDTKVMELALVSDTELMDISQVCHDLAIELEVPLLNHDAYMLHCINSRLNELNYSPLADLPHYPE